MAHKKRADYRTAKEMLFGIVDRKGLIEVQRVLKKAGDQQSIDLLRDIQINLIEKLDLDRGADEAISRLFQLGSRGKGWDPALIRNNVFKAANSLGMKLPSAMFASEDAGFRKALVRLAHTNPDIRRHVLPLLGVRREASADVPGPKMAKEVAAELKVYRLKPSIRNLPGGFEVSGQSTVNPEYVVKATVPKSGRGTITIVDQDERRLIFTHNFKMEWFLDLPKGSPVSPAYELAHAMLNWLLQKVPAALGRNYGGTGRASSLKAAIVRLAHANPNGIRKYLFPLLRESEGKTACRPDPEKMTPEDATEMAEGIMKVVGEKAQEFIQEAYDEIREQKGRIEDIEKAWKKWDWRSLEDMNLVSRKDRRFVYHVQSLYSW